MTSKLRDHEGGTQFFAAGSQILAAGEISGPGRRHHRASEDDRFHVCPRGEYRAAFRRTLAAAASETSGHLDAMAGLPLIPLTICIGVALQLSVSP